MGSALALLHAPAAGIMAGSIIAVAALVWLGRPAKSSTSAGSNPAPGLVEAESF